MKKYLVLLIILITAGLIYAQTCTGTWALTANGNCSTIGSVTGTSLIRANSAPIPTISYSVNGAGSNNWVGSVLDTSKYYEYTLTSTSNITITNFALVMQVNYTTMHSSIRYSLDGFATYSTLLADHFFGSSNPYSYTNSTMSVYMTSGQTMTIRVYAWNANATNKIFYNRNLVISGTRQTVATDYFKTIASGNWNQTSIWQSSLDGVTWISASLLPTAVANTTTINNSITLSATAECGNLAFDGGSINFGNYNLTINGTLSGLPRFTYSGTGLPSQTGTNAHIIVTIVNPTVLPLSMNSLTVIPGDGNSIILPNDISTANLIFTNGSITLGNSQVIVNGSISGASLFIYNGNGGISGSGATDANTVLGVNTSTTIPPEVNAIDVNPGVGNIAELPNNVTTTILTFTSGSLDFNDHKLTLALDDFAITGTQTVAGLFVSMTNTAHTYEENTGIAHTWQTSGSVVGTVDLTFSYPTGLSDSPKMSVYKRNYLDGESSWTWVGTYSTINNGATHSVIVPGITSLENSLGDLEWTISEVDETLPVELASFTATLTYDGKISLNWITQSETEVLGYHVFRNTANAIGNATCLTLALIPAYNTSSTHVYSFTDDEVGLEHVVYYYWLEYTEFSGVSVVNGPVTIEVNTDDLPPVPASITSLQSVFPNPFVNSTTIRYGLKAGDRISLEVYNIKGQLVRKLDSGYKVADIYDITWNGTDMNGVRCCSGIYYIVLNTSAVHTVRKLVKF